MKDGRDLTGKVALVTGAASGFGAGIAVSLADRGAQLVLADVNLTGAEEVAASLANPGLAISCNVASRDDVTAMFETVRTSFGKLDVIVNNAGVTHNNGSLLEVSEDDFDLIVAVNMKAVFHMNQLGVPMLIEGGGGSIVNTASTAALRPRPGLTWYNASKGWLVTATKSMAVELAPHNIRVNCICPVAGETPLLEKFMGEDTPEKRAAFLATVPLGRFSKPQDMGQAVAWLVSDEAAFITGVALEIDGGRCI